ncbi:hypothetical protein KIN20_026269 [Parelaphostrongylus tenuis]|uniref:Uncharacterized protein n=1 Tax=Parelaphostrongylus tenuis TaxID=148309 RepID=A0AAD5QXD2_PARTN|nr:hypothetical protein KIN20_026269 [Parelaphostrongylus tenuis]
MGSWPNATRQSVLDRAVRMLAIEDSLPHSMKSGMLNEQNGSGISGSTSGESEALS